MKRRLLSLMTSAVVMTMATTAVAQDAEVPEADGVVFVDLEVTEVDEEMVDFFNQQIRDIIAAESNLEMTTDGGVSMGDLQLMAGCSDTSADCLMMLSDFVDGQQLVHGSIERSDDIYMFDLELFDLERGEVVRSISEQTLRGDDTWIRDGMPAVAEHFFYGPTATVEVTVDGAPNAEIRVNGDAVGEGDARVEGVAPGEVVVVIRGDEIGEDMERFLVRHEEVREVVFDHSEDLVAPAAPDEADGPSLVPGFAALGVGAAGLALGAVGQMQLSSARDDANGLVSNGALSAGASPAQAQELQDDMDRAHTMRMVGLTTGAVGVAAGGVLLFRALSSSDMDGDESSLSSLHVVPSDDGFRAGLNLRF